MGLLPSTRMKKILGAVVVSTLLLAMVWGVSRAWDKRERAMFRKTLGDKHGLRAKPTRGDDGQDALAPWMSRAKDPDPRIRFQVLQIIPDSPETLPVFLASVEDREPAIRWYAGFRLSGFEENSAGLALKIALERKDRAVVAGAWQYFSGPFATRDEQTVLGEAFNDYGNEEMATALIGDRRPILSGAAAAWATQHGFMVVPKYR